MENRQIDKKVKRYKQARLDASFLNKLKIIAAQRGISIKDLIQFELEPLTKNVDM